MPGSDFFQPCGHFCENLLGIELLGEGSVRVRGHSLQLRRFARKHPQDRFQRSGVAGFIAELRAAEGRRAQQEIIGRAAPRYSTAIVVDGGEEVVPVGQGVEADMQSPNKHIYLYGIDPPENNRSRVSLPEADTI